MTIRRRQLVHKFFADRGTHLAAMVAYFALLSFVPLVFLTLSLFGLAHRAEASDFFIRELKHAFPGTSLDSIIKLVRRVQDNAAALGIIGFGRIGRAVAQRAEGFAMKVIRADSRVELTGTEFNLLRYFMLNPRRVLSKHQILQNVWRYDFGGNSNVVETYVSYLRRKLNKHGPPLIRTVRQAGYMLEHGQR